MLKGIERYRAALESGGSGLVLVGISERSRGVLERTGLLERLGAANVLAADPHLDASIERG